ncbi:ribosomal protein S18-alanine N-acetyltransferase [Rhodoblastus sp.]|jgi:ribosomal-protein-alanine N-acetyltransferase|uniref:ribosomal protein S18-alanine N-acetyltransferase n=1 Tax=Rhodoblastus sp. TaxID=1962975 RepID=UPI00261C36D6|nr:ribosomal protein S18-alanine N-acetyltransferase [Rhodoblastus sp.]
MKSPFFLRSTSFIATPRTLRLKDAEECSGLHRSGFAHSWSVAEFEALLRDPACFGDGVEDRNRLSGIILSRRALDEAEVLTVVVSPQARGKGMGRRLLMTHVARLAASGVKYLFLEVDESNEPALKLYRQFGFSLEGRRKNYYAQDQGGRRDALIMRRILT